MNFQPKNTWPPTSVLDREVRDASHSDDPLVREREVASEAWHDGAIDWYDHARAYGFIISDATGQQVFLHRRFVLKSDVKPVFLQDESRVQYRLRPASRPGGRDEAIAIRLVNDRRR
jgi:cold shock CspA family protein